MNDDRRARVARAISDGLWRKGSGPQSFDSVADAVLTALKDELIPELPEWVDHLHVYPGETVEVHLEGALGDFDNYAEAVGPTIPAALRTALGEDDDQSSSG